MQAAGVQHLLAARIESGGDLDDPATDAAKEKRGSDQIGRDVENRPVLVTRPFVVWLNPHTPMAVVFDNDVLTGFRWTAGPR
jgi:hypothetical protein